MKHLCLCLALLLICGCTTMRGVDDHVDFDLASQTTIYRDQWVRQSPLEVHVRPREQATYAPKILFIPFRVTQPINSPNEIGYAAARNIYQTWLTMQIFPAMEFSGDSTPYRRDRAVQLAKMRGADMVIGGFVTYIYAGGTAGDSQIALHVEIHDTHSGQLIWSMAQSGLMPASKTNDYLLFATKTRLPSDPIHAISKVIGVEMGKELQNWIAPMPVQPANRDQRVHDAIFAPRDPQPIPRPQTQEPTQEKSF